MHPQPFKETFDTFFMKVYPEYMNISPSQRSLVKTFFYVGGLLFKNSAVSAGNDDASLFAHSGFVGHGYVLDEWSPAGPEARSPLLSGQTAAGDRLRERSLDRYRRATHTREAQGAGRVAALQFLRELHVVTTPSGQVARAIRGSGFPADRNHRR